MNIPAVQLEVIQPFVPALALAIATPDDERSRFNAMVSHYGTPQTRLASQYEPLADDGVCWGTAWAYARRATDAGAAAHYVEGMVAGDGSVVRAHAWVELDRDDGSTFVVELTRGYQHYTHYLGIRVSHTPLDLPDRDTLEWTTQADRCSVIEAYILSGLMPDEILARIA